MNLTDATKSLGALAHESRLSIFRLLVLDGDEVPAGRIAEQLGISPQALSFHLKDLLNAELIVQRYEGRRIFYRARFEAMNGLIRFLTENCCQGTRCQPVADAMCIL